ncbi:hypothetical protein Tco_0167572 [Tanacetum coccineum]
MDQSASGKLRDRNAEEFWALLEDIALYDNKKRNRNPSSPKRVHFVNSFVILNKEKGNVQSNTTEYDDHEMTVESKEEFEEETEEEIEEEEEEDSPKHFDTFPTMKELRNFTYECDFVVLEDSTSVIDHELGSVIFGKPFVESIGLVYDNEEGTITFEKDKENIVFKIPHRMEMFEHIDFTDIKTDRIPLFVIESDDDKKNHYSDRLDLGLEYKRDENVYRAIQSLITMKVKRNKGEVT